jgi:hypothetical protein
MAQATAPILDSTFFVESLQCTISGAIGGGADMPRARSPWMASPSQAQREFVPHVPSKETIDFSGGSRARYAISSDDGLSGEVLQQCDLLVGEWTNFLTIDG